MDEKYNNISVSLGLMNEEGYRLLAEQKLTIIELQTNLILNIPVPEDKRIKYSEDIEGLINFLDHIQDQAVEKGVPEEVVFPFSEQANEIRKVKQAPRDELPLMINNLIYEKSEQILNEKLKQGD